MIALIIVSGSSQLFTLAAGQTSESIAESFGITDPSLYAEFPETDFDPACYNFPGAFTLSGGVVGFSLTAAKEQGKRVEKNLYASLELAATDGYSTNQLSSQASIPAASRLPEVQAVLDTVNTLAVELNNKLNSIDSAANIEDLNNIVYPPTGTLFTGRGSGLGPEDLNVSYYTEFNSASLTEAETELYVPGTSTVIPYGSGGPGKFDSMGNAFNPGDYLIQIRETATSRVIAEFEVPLNPTGEDVAF